MAGYERGDAVGQVFRAVPAGRRYGCESVNEDLFSGLDWESLRCGSQVADVMIWFEVP
jgi:hypothetical protein